MIHPGPENTQGPSLSFVLLGAGGRMTRTVSRALIAGGAHPLAAVQEGGPTRPLGSLPGTALECRNDWLSSLPDGITRRHADSISDLAGFLRALRPDLLLVACWSRRLPQSVLDAARIAAINLHPSLLPEWPGFDPVGDQLRAGVRDFGVTLHRMTESIDRGPVVSRQGFTFERPDALTVETAAARLGAALFIDLLSRPEAFNLRS